MSRTKAGAVVVFLEPLRVFVKCFFVFVVVDLGATAQTDAHLRFEVASIKTASPNPRFHGIAFNPGGRIEVTDQSLKQLIAAAWRLQPFQVSGGPPWLDSARYDIVAKSETKPKPGEIDLMIQSLLEDRFQLTVHHETRELPVYTLVMARKDANPGPQLAEAKDGSCTQPDPAKPAPQPEPGKPPMRLCGHTMMSSRRLTAVSVPISQLTQMLSRFLGRTIVDKTGLTGNFDVTLEWTPDDVRSSGAPPADVAAPSMGKKGGSDVGTVFPPLPIALQQQLGLKLDLQKGPVEILVIDRAERPSEN